MMDIFKESSKTTVENFRNASIKGEFIDAKKFYGAFAMDVIASSAFSTKLDSHNDPENKFVRLARKVMADSISWKHVLVLVYPPLLKWFKIDFFPTEVSAFFKKLTLDIIEERTKTGETKNDLLQLLLDTAKEVEDHLVLELPETPAELEDIAFNYGTHEDIHPRILKSVMSKSLSMDELVANSINFFLSGYDPATNTLSFASYFLALNPDKQEKLRSEVDEVLKEHNGELTYEAVLNMKYLDNVISETLRMYPPVMRLERTADSDHKLGDTGITIPKGMVVSIPIYAIQRDPNIFPNPDTFQPERFDSDDMATRHPFTYLPFGGGPRNCIAMRFALMEVKVCLAHVIAHFNIKACPETKIPLEFGKGQVILRPQGIVLQMETRSDASFIM
ncbi:hypothetical protein JTE90_018699 [Oedothorax gibbosus]|uniref:Cytochrome P450 n=1 Tax=Oedothorax gibbosus TaxID=931172 RepID=A0AAV6TYR1_9ARAC|nr:hypothetical protein JTE90_018699 [Oedothorax gibbosus]